MTRQLVRLLVTLFAIAGLALFAVACGDDDDSSDSGSGGDKAQSDSGSSGSKKPIVVGTVVAETGFLSNSDLPPLNGLKVAIQDINDKGGVLGRPLELVVRDMKSDRTKGSAAALETIDEGAVLGVVSCDLDFGSPAAIEFAKKDILSLSLCAGSPDYGPRGVSPLTFSAGQATPSEAAGAANFAYEEKGFKTAYILKDTLLDYSMTWGSNFKKSFEAYGGKIVGEDKYNNEDASVQTQIARMKAVNPQPDAIAMCGVQPGGPAAIRQMRSAGVTAPLVMCDGLDGKNWLPSVPGLKDAFVVSYGDASGNDPEDAINEFFTKYKDQFDEPNNGHPLMGYATAEILVEGIEKANSTDGPAIQGELEKMKDFQSIVGCTTFDAEWHVSFCRPTAFQEIKDGKMTFAARVNPESDKVFYPE
jgi:branched-chain amino acid transport system substrate-binding protein